MKKLFTMLFSIILFISFLLTGCANKPPVVVETPTTSITNTPTATATMPPTATSTATLEPTPTEVIYESGYAVEAVEDGMILLYVPAGEFTMGFSEITTASPQHTVYLDAFWIDQNEVTNAMYQKCVEAGICTPPHETTWDNRFEYYGTEYYANSPVMKVDREQAQTYCNWVGRSLPTEAQWEKAARGTDGRIFPWGDILTKDYANYGDGSRGPTPVRSYNSGKSPYGAFDMAGNVWEWVLDYYSPYRYSNDPIINPVGPTDGTILIVRGGAYGNVEHNIPTYFRGRIDLDDDYNIWRSPWAANGFRCAKDASQQKNRDPLKTGNQESSTYVNSYPP